jgi:hypothetical protein
MNIDENDESTDAKQRDFVEEMLAPEIVEKAASPDSPAREEKSSKFLNAAYCWVLSRN